MSVAVIEQIADVLFNRLSALLDQDLYDDPASSIIRPTRYSDITPEDRQIVVSQGDDEIVDELSYPGNPPSIARRQVFNIRCYLMPSDRDARSVDEQINQLFADVVRAVYTSSTWHTFDNLAVDAGWLAKEYFSSDGGIEGFTMPLAITYKTDEGNPYNVRF
jgi:hypothetical protein